MDIPAGGDGGGQGFTRGHVAAFQAGHQDARRVAHVFPEIGAGAEEGLVLRLGQMGGPGAGGVDRADFLGRLAVDRAEALAGGGVADDDEGPVLGIPARGRADRGVQHLRDQRVGHRRVVVAAQGARGVDCLEQPDIGHRRSPCGECNDAAGAAFSASRGVAG